VSIAIVITDWLRHPCAGLVLRLLVQHVEAVLATVTAVFVSEYFKFVSLVGWLTKVWRHYHLLDLWLASFAWISFVIE
jgi:hypothetical protein